MRWCIGVSRLWGVVWRARASLGLFRATEGAFGRGDAGPKGHSQRAPRWHRATHGGCLCGGASGGAGDGAGGGGRGCPGSFARGFRAPEGAWGRGDAGPKGHSQRAPRWHRPRGVPLRGCIGVSRVWGGAGSVDALWPSPKQRHQKQQHGAWGRAQLTVRNCTPDVRLSYGNSVVKNSTAQFACSNLACMPAYSCLLVCVVEVGSLVEPTSILVSLPLSLTFVLDLTI